MINPLNYKGDVLVQVWMDSRVLATLTRWMDGEGVFPRFMSQAVRRPLELIAELLVDGGDVKMIEDTGEARRMLESRFQIKLNRGGRGEKNVVHNITLSDRRDELGERMRRTKITNDVSRPKRRGVLTEEELNKAVEIYNSLGTNQERRRDDSKVVTDSLEAMRIAEEVGREESLVKESMSDEEFESKMSKIDERDKKEKEEMDKFLEGLKESSFNK